MVKVKSPQYQLGVTPTPKGTKTTLNMEPIDVNANFNSLYKPDAGITAGVTKLGESSAANIADLAGVSIVKETLPEIYSPKTDGKIVTEPLPKTPKTSEELYTDYRKGQAILAGAQFVSDYLNANAAYNTVKGQAQLNILQARNQGADALYRGRQAQMDRQSEGYQQGQSALLTMAAQGQDVGGAGVQKIQASLEAMGIYNGMQEEINSMKEALGYELEEVNYRYQINQAKNQRDAAVLGSAINLGANLVGVI